MRPASAEDPRIDGLVPQVVLEPSDEQACAEALALCHAEDLAVVPVGGATTLELGNPPSRLDAYVVTRGIAGGIDHTPGDLTVSVLAGTTLDELQSKLRDGGQFLPLEAPLPERATIGGIFAVGEPGTRRRPGARARDLLLGFEGILVDGTRVRSGGRVVKNVAGYEISKLFVGSYGTLAIMTRAFLRLRALPERVCTLAVAARRDGSAAALWREIVQLSFQPEVAALLNPSAATAFGFEDWTLLLRFEGLDEEVSGGASTVQARIGGEMLPGETTELWNGVRDFRLRRDGGVVLRGQVVPARTFELAGFWQDGGQLIAYPESGLIFSHTEDSDALQHRIEMADGLGANVVLERVDSELKTDRDVFGEVPGGFELMKRIKEKLDPKGLLSPGRFVGRL